MAQLLDTREPNETVHPDMSVREVLSAVAAGAVTAVCVERGGEDINLWSSPGGDLVGPWHATGRRLRFLSGRDLTVTRMSGAVELTTLGWRWFAQLVRPLTAEEVERGSRALQPRDPRDLMRWRYGRSPKAARAYRIV